MILVRFSGLARLLDEKHLDNHLNLVKIVVQTTIIFLHFSQTQAFLSLGRTLLLVQNIE